MRIRGGDAHANFPRNLLDFDRMVANALGGGAMAARVQRGDMELISTLVRNLNNINKITRYSIWFENLVLVQKSNK